MAVSSHLNLTNKYPMIWIIDDDSIFTFIIEQMINLSSLDYRLKIFSDAEIALSELQKHQHNTSNLTSLPKVIFLDINMPMFDGWQFLDALYQFKTLPKIPIYLVSSSIDPKDHKKATEYSIVRKLIVKPISIDLLEEIKKDLI